MTTKLDVVSSRRARAIDKSGSYVATRPRLITMDPATQMGEMRQPGTDPEWVVGCGHAFTHGGDPVIASASGSQLGSRRRTPGQPKLPVGRRLRPRGGPVNNRLFTIEGLVGV